MVLSLDTSGSVVLINYKAETTIVYRYFAHFWENKLLNSLIWCPGQWTSQKVTAFIHWKHFHFHCKIWRKFTFICSRPIPLLWIAFTYCYHYFYSTSAWTQRFNNSGCYSQHHECPLGSCPRKSSKIHPKIQNNWWCWYKGGKIFKVLGKSFTLRS